MRVVAAAPAYLQTAGGPRTPADLRAHSLIVGPAARTQEAWTFHKDRSTTSVRPEGYLVINGNEAVVASVIAGLGIVSSGLLAFRNELERGTLVRVLPEWQMGSADVHVILPAGRRPSFQALGPGVRTIHGDGVSGPVGGHERMRKGTNHVRYGPGPDRAPAAPIEAAPRRRCETLLPPPSASVPAHRTPPATP